MDRSLRLPLLLVLIVTLLASACSGPGSRDEEDPTPTPSPASAVAITPSSQPSELLSSTATASVAPTSLPDATATARLPATATTPPTATSPPATATLPPDPTPESQAIGLPDVEAHYQLDIDELDIPSGLVRAREVITISAFRSTVPDWLYLQVVPAHDGFFTLNSAVVQDEAIQPEMLNGGFTLAFDLPDEPPVPYEVALDFTLNVGYEASGWAVTALDGDVMRLGNWFPIISNDHGYSNTLDPSYTASANYDVTVALDPAVWFAHTGELVSEETLEDGRMRYALHAEHVRDFALCLSAAYTFDSGVSATGVTIETYTIGASAETRANLLAWAADAIDQLSALIGPYPYQTFRIADAGPSMPGGVEFPQMIYINSAYDPLSRLIYHEVAHQWLYGILGTRTLLDGWIDEGGAEFFERGLPTGFDEVPEPPSGGYLYPLDATYLEMTNDGSRTFYYSIYEQGARLYYDVLGTMGWDAFWSAMSELYSGHQFGIMTAWDVLSAWQAASATDLRPLFHDYFRYDWIDQLPPPSFAGP